LEKEFLELSEAYGVNDLEELNKNSGKGSEYKELT